MKTEKYKNIIFRIILTGILFFFFSAEYVFANFSSCGDSAIFIYNGEQISYGTVLNPETGRCWLDRNLGVDPEINLSSITSYSNGTIRGDLFQWGRADDGHQLRTSSITSTLANTNTPNHSNFIINSSFGQDWRSPKNDNLWQGLSGINNPCPDGFRLPTEEEFNQEMNSWTSKDIDGAFSSPLKLATFSYRLGTNGSFSSSGTGYYWTSSFEISSARRARISSTSSGTSVGAMTRSTGLAVRCILDQEYILTVPIITTVPVTNINQTSATLNANLTDMGGADSVDVSFEYSTDSGLAGASTVGTDTLSATGTFNHILTGLSANTTYYFRAVATNNAGTSYGSILSFTTTTNVVLPSIETNPNGEIEPEIQQNLIPQMTSNTTPSGVASVSSRVTTSYDARHAMDRSSSTRWSSSSAGRTPSWIQYQFESPEIINFYSIQAHATDGQNSPKDWEFQGSNNGSSWTTLHTVTNEDNWSGGETRTFSFQNQDSYLYYRVAISANNGGTYTSISQLTMERQGSFYEADIFGNLTNMGNDSSVTVSFQYSTDSGLSGASTVGIDTLSATGTFNHTLTGLLANTTYYFRAVATNSAGTSYGSIFSFSVAPEITLPSTTTSPATSIDHLSSILNANLTDMGGADSVDVSFQYSTDSGLSGASTVGTDTLSATGTFNHTLTGLLANTTYYFRAVATNEVGTSYGDILSFTTAPEPTAPTVVTNSPTSVEISSTIVNASLTSLGTDTSTIISFQYSTDSGLSGASTVGTDTLSATGTFNHTLTGLLANTTYYFRAVATNEVGTSYGDILSFTTEADLYLPLVEIIDSINIKDKKLTIIANLLETGNDAEVDIWIEYSTYSDMSNNQMTCSTKKVAPGFFHATIINLEPETIYYFRAVAENSLGSSYSITRSYETAIKGIYLPNEGNILIKYKNKEIIVKISSEGIIEIKH